MHGKDAFLRQDEVHHGEDGFLDFSSVAGATDDDFLRSVVDDHKALGVQTVALRVGLKVRCMENGKFGLVLGQLFCIRADEHVASERVVPGVVVDHADGQGFGKVRAAVQILHEQRILLRQELYDLGSHTDEGVHVGRDVDIPPVDVAGDRRLVDDELVIGGASCSLTGFGHKRTVSAQNAFTTVHRKRNQFFGRKVPVHRSARGNSVV